jgi:hypothetical protein
MSRKQLDKFLRLLKAASSGAVFNPWWQIDEENDIGRIAPIIRRQQLRAYVQERLGRAKLVVIGEALGYRGGHFTGIPMTSERMLFRKQKDAVAALYERRNLEHRAGDGGHRPPLQILSGIKPRRTSKPSVCPGWFFGTDGDDCLGRVTKSGSIPGACPTVLAKARGRIIARRRGARRFQACPGSCFW